MNDIVWTKGADALDFPERFRKVFGRPPRVLHIGNVANYAFINARIQKGAGVEVECLDPNFYHIMASPEWVEATIRGDHGDDFAPKWSKVDLGAYRRPDWFIQGDEDLAFAVLKARRAGDGAEARRLARLLDLHRRAVTQDIVAPKGLVEILRESQHPLARFTRKALKRFIYRERAAIPPPSPALPAPDYDSFATPPPDEVKHYIVRAPLYRGVLEAYDIVHGYTVQGVYPAAAGLPNFVSYELGTIRGLPFEDSPMGRLTKWAYLMSPEVFVTNIDCLPAAARMGLDMGHVHKALHAFDVDAAIAFARDWSETPDDGETPVFYAPARQHWKEGNDSILKGNDVAIRGAALLKAKGYRFQLVLGEWGSEVHLTKALIAELGLGDRIGWTRPLPRSDLWPTYMRARAIVDQFRSPAFGGVSLEAMALGRRLITAYDHDHGKAFFSGPPPIFNCRTPEAVADAMAACLADPLDSAGRGRAAQEWMAREHSVARQLREQYEVYEILLSRLDHDGRRWVAPAPA